jgi:transketolase
MAGIAAGLALTGKKVFCYSIIPFLVMRAYEQIRVDICFQNLDVNFVGVA